MRIRDRYNVASVRTASVLFALACWLCLAPQAGATALGSLILHHALWAGPNDGNPKPQRTPSSPVGTLPGSFTVSDQGSAHYSIPLDVPPAARGLEPELALEYDSQVGNGPLGVGWQLAGLSAITRCGHTLADDDEVTPVRMTNEDALCLDGERLILVEGAAFEVGATYRPKRDDFSRVRVIASFDANGNGCHGGFGFELRRRDQTIATYGCSRDASVSTHLGVRTWAVSQLRDRFGNSIDYHYAYELEDVFDGEGQWLGEADVEHVLSSIDYGAHLDLHEPTRQVRFDWEPRPDPFDGWSLGAPQRQSRRLARITTFAEGALGTRYELDYDTPTVTGRSLLTSVRQCDGEGVCKPATTFEWEPGELGLDTINSGGNFSMLPFFPYMASTGDANAPDPQILGQTVLDANGDGLTDMLLAVGWPDFLPSEGRGWELWTSQPDADNGANGIFCGTTHPQLEACIEQGYYVVEEADRTDTLAHLTYEDLGFPVPPMFASDYDGDGRDDAYALGHSVNIPGGVPPAGRLFHIVRSLAEGGIEQFEFDPEVEIIWWFSGADQNGDGLGDLLFCGGEALLDAEDEPVTGTGTWHFVPNLPGLGFDQANLVDTGVACSVYDKFLHFDHDGDGLDSLVLIPVWDTGAKAWIPAGEWPDYRALRLDPNQGWATSLEPVGLPPDLAQRWRATLLSNHNDVDDWFEADFPRSQQGFGIDRVLDLNSDGLPDVLRYELSAGDGPEQLHVIKNTIVGLDPPLDEWGGVRVWINTGADFVDGGWLVQSDKKGDGLFRRFLASSVVDYDSDGRLDYLLPSDEADSDDWSWSVWVTTGDGGFVEHPHVFEYPLPDYSFAVQTLGTFDFDGDTLHDPGLLYGGSWTLWEHVGAAPDRLVRIENGLGAWVEVGYRSLMEFEAPVDFYEAELDDCVYPERCERDPRIVVAWHELDNGYGGDARRFEHRYGPARSDREGRRGLGFEFHETTELDDQDRPIYRRRVGFAHTYDANLRDFPHAGMPATVLVDRRDPETGRHFVTYVWRIFDELETTPRTYYPYVSQEITRSYELGACPETFCEVGDLHEDERVSDLVDTIHELDAYGSPLIWTSSIDTGSTTITYRYERSYANDEATWLLGLPNWERLTFHELGHEPRERDWVAVYDLDTGALQSHIVEPTEPELFLHTSFGYDEHGNLTSRTATDMDAEQRGSTVEYDERGVFPIKGTNALGHGSALRWDAALGVPIEAADPNGVRLIADYDGLGHVTGLRSFVGNLPRGDDTTFSYEMLPITAAGSVLEIRSDTAGHGYAEAHYDRLGRLIEEHAPGLDGLRRDVFTRYDRLGRVSQVSLPTPFGLDPDFELFEHDFADRLIRHELADGTAETWAHDGLETLHVDIGGTMSVLEHDLAGRLTKSTRALGTPDEERMCFDYGAWEELVRARPDCIERTAGILEPGEAPPTIKSYVYDDLGQLIYSHDPSEGPRSLFYNGHGELELYVDGKGAEVELERDALGRVIFRTDADGVTSWVWDLDFIGELSSTMSPDGHEEVFAYDAFGRVETLTKVIAGEVFELGFTYDEFDRLAQIHYPEHDALPGFWIRNVHAQNGELREVRSGPDDALLWRVELLDGRGRVAEERFGNDAVTVRDHDPLRDFVREIETTSELGGTLQALEYQWNHDGTLGRRDDHLHGQHEIFEYDDLHRVRAVHTTKEPTTYSRHFAYDSLGNLVFATDRGEYEYDIEGRLAVSDGSGYEWDGNGNLLARTGARPAELVYTAFDKPATIADDGALTDLEYDASQQRVYRYSEADGRETIYVGELYQRHHDELGGETQHHYYVPGLERTVASVVDTVGLITGERSVHYVHADHLGSTDVVSDASGMVEQRMAFDVWGKRRDPGDWTLPEDFAQLGAVNLGYTGHEAQEDAGLMHMGGRMYDPHLGRMVGADPLVVDPTSAQGWNRYAYVLNRPLTLTDPSGFEPTEVSTSDSDSDDGGDPGGSGDHPGGASGVMGKGQATQGSAKGGMRHGGSSQPKANQRAGENGPGAGGNPPRGDNLPRGPGMSDAIANFLLEGVKQIGRLGPGVPPRHPLEGAAGAMIDMKPGGESRERRRLHHSDESGGRVIDMYQNPPDHVVISIEITLFFIGGDLEAVGGLVQGGMKIIGRKGGEKGVVPLVIGAVKDKAKKRGPKPWPTGPHNQTIERRIKELKAQGHHHTHGGNLPEETVKTVGGHKSTRRPDITAVAPDGTVHRENVGRATKRGRHPIARERRALDDIEGATGVRPKFTPYN